MSTKYSSNVVVCENEKKEMKLSCCENLKGEKGRFVGTNDLTWTNIIYLVITAGFYIYLCSMYKSRGI
jgi:hypothetical protein